LFTDKLKVLYDESWEKGVYSACFFNKSFELVCEKPGLLKFVFVLAAMII